MCNKNGEPHPLSKFPPSEWEVRWKHKSVVEGIAICNERDLLPYHGVLGKAKQSNVVFVWGRIEIQLKFEGDEPSTFIHKEQS
jgi:hypothetical protein